MTDIERLAKVAGVLKWRMYRPGTYCVGTKPTFMVVGGTLTDSGWKACVEWLMDKDANERCRFRPWGVERPQELGGLVWFVRFATPGKPTGDELGRAVLEVSDGNA